MTIATKREAGSSGLKTKVAKMGHRGQVAASMQARSISGPLNGQGIFCSILRSHPFNFSSRGSEITMTGSSGEFFFLHVLQQLCPTPAVMRVEMG